MTDTIALSREASLDAPLPKAGFLDTLCVLAEVIIPTVAKGAIIRRAVRRMQWLRDKYGAGPLMLPIPFRPQASFSRRNTSTARWKIHPSRLPLRPERNAPRWLISSRKDR